MFKLFSKNKKDDFKEEKLELPDLNFKMSRSVKIITSKGTMDAELYDDDAPATVNHFCKLVEKGFYQGMLFHRYIPNLLVQTGCPKGDGTGGAGFYIKCELDGSKQIHDRGVLSMAHSGRDTGSSQFFICLNRENTQYFDGNHTCFGKITKGIELLNTLRLGDQLIRIELAFNKIALRQK